MNLIFYIIIFTGIKIFATGYVFDFRKCKELDKSTIDFKILNDKEAVISMAGKDYFPSFAVSYAEKNEVAKALFNFNGYSFEQCCKNNSLRDKRSLRNFFKKLKTGVFELKTYTYFILHDKEVEIFIGFIKANVFKDILTKTMEAIGNLDYDDPSYDSAKNAIIENMKSECESNIILYGIRFPDSHGEDMAKLEDYKVFEYERLDNIEDYKYQAKEDLFNFNETKKNEDYIYDKGINYYKFYNDSDSSSDIFSLNNENYVDTDENEYKKNDDKSSSSSTFKKTGLLVIGVTLLTVGVFGFMIFIGRVLYLKYF